MDIKVLGTDCIRCTKLYELVRAIVESAGLDASLEKVEDMDQILDFGILTIPGLVIDGEVKSVGKIPSRTQIEEWLGIGKSVG